MSVMMGWIVAGAGAAVYVWGGVRALLAQRGVKISYTTWSDRVPVFDRVLWYLGIVLLAAGLIMLAFHLVWWDVLYFAALITFMTFMIIGSHNRAIVDNPRS